ncbi:MAG: hypothetical protein WBL79_11230, partial [Bacillota bacterium]
PTSGKTTPRQGRRRKRRGLKEALRGNTERSESELKLACQVGNLAKYGKARKLDNLGALNGRLRQTNSTGEALHHPESWQA